jgi:RNA polymerase sigma-70 factor (ECF subfamily)
MSPPAESPDTELPRLARGSWHRFLDTYEPLRSALYRYCRHLTRSPWDAEDLAQDTLTRAFVTLAQMGEAPANPRAWLLRVASNLWIDRMRRRRPEEPLAGEVPGATAADPIASREAAGTLLGQLSPQERAAVVLKDVFELSLDDVAEALSTTAGSIKAALHRARGKLARVEPDVVEPDVVEPDVVEPDVVEPDVARVPAPGVLDEFCAAFNAGDLDRLTSLLLDSAAVEVVGATTQYGPEAARRTVLPGMLFGSRRMASADVDGGIEARFVLGVLPSAPRVEVREHRGEWLLLHWYAHRDGEFVRAITRVEAEGDRVSRLRNYFFTPDFVAEICGELGVPSRPNGHRWWLSGC